MPAVAADNMPRNHKKLFKMQTIDANVEIAFWMWRNYMVIEITPN